MDLPAYYCLRSYQLFLLFMEGVSYQSPMSGPGILGTYSSVWQDGLRADVQ